MIKQIADIVKILIESTAKAKSLHDEHLNKNDKIQLIKSLLLFQGVHKDGEQLLKLATPNPAEQIKALSSEALELRLQTWDTALRRQGARLYQLNGFIANRSDLTLLNLKAQRQIKVIIGSKLDRVSNLFELGAGLFFRTKLPISESPETVAELVTRTLQIDTTRAFDLLAIQSELRELDEAVEEYKKFIISSLSTEDIRLLSPKAQKEADEE